MTVTGLPWSFPVEVYSVDCISFELWMLMGVHPITMSLHNTLAFMEKVIGPFCEKFVSLMQEDYKSLFFSSSPPHVKPSHDMGDSDRDPKYISLHFSRSSSSTAYLLIAQRIP